MMNEDIDDIFLITAWAGENIKNGFLKHPSDLRSFPGYENDENLLGEILIDSLMNIPEPKKETLKSYDSFEI